MKVGLLLNLPALPFHSNVCLLQVFQAGFISDQPRKEGNSQDGSSLLLLVVILHSLRGARPRKGKDHANPSLTVRVVPGAMRRKGVTSVYEEASDILFDLERANDDDGDDQDLEEIETEDSTCLAGNVKNGWPAISSISNNCMVLGLG